MGQQGGWGGGGNGGGGYGGPPGYGPPPGQGYGPPHSQQGQGYAPGPGYAPVAQPIGAPMQGQGYGPAPQGRVKVTLGFIPLQWILYFVTPNIEINGAVRPFKWGTHEFDMPAGQYQLMISFPYFLQSHCCAARGLLTVYPGCVTQVTYDAPFFMWSNGTMIVHPPVNPGAIAMLPPPR